MDPLSIAGSVAGFLSLTIEIVKILSNYTSDVQDSPKAARSLLTEVIALKHVLEQFVTFLQAEDTNSKCRFQETSALYSIITICKTHIQTLFRKLKFQCETDLLGRLKWPFSKGECTQLVDVLHRCTQTFTFSLTIENCSLLSKTSTELDSRLDEVKNSLESLTSSFPTLALEMTKMRDTLTDILDFLRLNVAVAADVQKISMGVERVEKSIQRIDNTLQDDQSRKLFEWLSPLEPLKRHQDVLSMRLDNTGGWLLNDQRFIEWKNGGNGQDTDHQVLCCYGLPGAGKTFMTAAVIAWLSQSIDRSVGVACIYCDYRDQSQQTPRALLGSILAQFLAGMVGLSTKVVLAYESASKKRIALEVDEAIALIVDILDSFERVFICIDAVDELRPDTQRIFLHSMRQLLRSNTKIRLFLTGRPHIKPQVHEHLSTGPESRIHTHTEIEIVASVEDIKHFLSSYIEEKDPMPDRSAMNEVLKLKIIETITAKSGGMFLLPALHIQSILEEPTIGDREDALEVLPSALPGAFKQTMDRIRQQPKTRANQGMTILTWVFLAKRRLSLEELQYAVAVRTDKGTRAFEFNRLCSKNTLLGSCLGLVTLDKETATVRLVHYSLQEYLEDPEAGVLSPQKGHELIARTCLTYLRICQNLVTPAVHVCFGAGYMDRARELRRQCRCKDPGCTCSPISLLPLVEYAATEWGHHARDGYTPSLEALAIDYLTTELISPCTCILDYLVYRENEIVGELAYFSGWMDPDENPRRHIIHHVAYFGEPHIFMALYNSISTEAIAPIGIDGLNINIRDEMGRTSLTWAAIAGNYDLVQLLLDHHEVEVDVKDEKGLTPLAYAAGMCHGHIVRLLLFNPRVDPDSKDNTGRTPLSHAAQRSSRGSLDIVRILLQKPRIDPDSKCHVARTPLSYAVAGGHPFIVCLLLQDRRVDPASKDNQGRTPLSHAAEFGDPYIVRILLLQYCYRVDLNSKDHNGRTPLSYAAEQGSWDNVSLFLENLTVDLDSKDNEGRTPLSHAVESGNSDIVGLLLQPTHIDHDSKDNEGRTPLSHAAESGNPDTVSLLLQSTRIDHDSKDNEGRTPLSHAAESGYSDIVGLLLQSTRTDHDSKDNEGRTPLSYAAEEGSWDNVSLFLENLMVDPDSKDNEGRTPLSYAAEQGSWDNVSLFLENLTVDPDSKDNEGRTPLSHAAESGDSDIVGLLLLQTTRIDHDSKDNEGRTPLSHAVESGNPDTVSLLLQSTRIDHDSKDNEGRTPLSHAAECGDPDILNTLLQDPRVDSDIEDNHGRTPLSYAAELGSKRDKSWPSNNIYLARKPVDYKRTPLSPFSVELLLGKGADPDHKDKHGKTPLDWALGSPDPDGVLKEIIEILQKHMKETIHDQATKRRISPSPKLEPNAKRQVREADRIEALNDTTFNTDVGDTLSTGSSSSALSEYR